MSTPTPISDDTASSSGRAHALGLRSLILTITPRFITYALLKGIYSAMLD
ncbi:hypothetical protein ACTJI8_19820 [Microbacterium sp. 22303]